MEIGFEQTKADVLENTRLKQELHAKRRRWKELQDQIEKIVQEKIQVEDYYNAKEASLNSKMDKSESVFSPMFLNAPAFQQLEHDYNERVKQCIENVNKAIQYEAELAGLDYTDFIIDEE